MNKKIHIAMLGSFPPLRGISSYCYKLATTMAGNNYRVDFISFKSMYPRFLYPGKDLTDDLSFPTTSCENLNVNRAITWYNPASWITQGIKGKAALLHAQWWSLPLAPIYICICLLYKIRCKPIVFTVHNVLPHEHSPLFFYLSRFLFKFGNHFIVHSQLNRQQLTDVYHIPCDQISLIPHGPLDHNINLNVDRKIIREELGFVPENKVILLFGAVRPYKGIDSAIDAFARVKKQISTARLLIAGKLWEDWEPYASLIKHHEIDKEVATHLNYIPSAEVHRYFVAADLVILPYHHFDSQSGVGGTAVAFRKPMIVTRVGGLPELVIDPKAVVSERDPAALAEAIITTFNDPARLKKMAKDADTVAKRISWDNIVTQTTGIYKRLLEKTKAEAAL